MWVRTPGQTLGAEARVHGRQTLAQSREIYVHTRWKLVSSHTCSSAAVALPPQPRCRWDAGPESWTHRPPCKSGLVTGVCLQRGAHWARPPLGAGSTREQGRRGAVGVGLGGLAPAPSGAFLGRRGRNANPGPRIPRPGRAPHTRSPQRNLDAEQSSVGARGAGGAGQVGPAAGQQPSCTQSWKSFLEAQLWKPHPAYISQTCSAGALTENKAMTRQGETGLLWAKRSGGVP